MSRSCNKHYFQRGVFIGCCLLLAACSSTPANDVAKAPSAASKTVSATGPVTGEQPVVATVPPEAQQKFDAAMKVANAGKHDEAALQLEQLAADYPTLAAPLINEGLLYLKRSQFDAAERTFKRALQRDAKSTMANNYLGVAQRNLGKFKEAETAYQAALAVDDTYGAAHLNLGVLYDLYLQQPELAIKEYERYQQLLPTPDTKVAGWVKELKLRSGKTAKPAANAQGKTS